MQILITFILAVWAFIFTDPQFGATVNIVSVIIFFVASVYIGWLSANYDTLKAKAEKHEQYILNK